MKKNRTEILVGTFVIFGFLLLSLIVFFVSGVYLVRPGYHVKVQFNYVSILDKGAPVRMAGVRIGEVNKVRLLEDLETGQMMVEAQLFIAKGFEIRENYAFNVRGTHILSEPHIEITPQPGRAPLLKDETTVRGVDPVPMDVLVNRAETIASQLEAILSRVKGALEDKQTEGDLKESIAHLKSSAESLDAILERMEKGEGTLGKLVSEDELYQDIREFVKEIKAKPWKLLKKDEKKGVPGVPFI